MVQPDSKRKKKIKKKSHNNGNKVIQLENQKDAKVDESTQQIDQKGATVDETGQQQNQQSAKVSENFLKRFGLKQRSKTLADFPGRNGAEEDSFDKRPSSFRRRINTFIQNSSILQRTPLLRRSGSMKQGVNLLNVSSESLAIEEDKVLVLRPWENRVDLATRQVKCRSLEYKCSLRSFTEEDPASSKKNAFLQRSTSVSTSLHFVPAWLRSGKSIPSRYQSSTDISPASHQTQETRSRSLTHIDQLESNSDSIFADMGERSSEIASNSRRHMLTRSEAQTAECFSVGFEGLLEEMPDEYVQVSNQVPLKDALLEVCKRKSVDLSLSSVFLDVNKSPLPCLDIDTSWMGGKHIRIKVNDRVVRWESKGNATPLRKISSTHKSGKSGLRTQNVSSEEPSVAESSAAKSKRWSGFFGTSRDHSKMESLVELLDSYNRSGILGAQDGTLPEDIYNLESDWKSIVVSHGSLDAVGCQQQEAIWELICSELQYIKMLRVVCHLFLSCLVSLQANQLLIEIDNNKLFSNIVEICKCNENFWKQTILPLVEESRRSGAPLNPELLKDGFSRFATSFQCYKTYCVQQSSCQRYCRERMTQEQDHELFTAYLAWCETQKECNRLKLLDILVKPMQRLTKYSLLIKAVLKHTTSSTQQDALQLMIRQVDEFVNHVNTTLRQQQELQQLRQLVPKLESYELEVKDEDLGALVHKYTTLSLTDYIPHTNHHRALIFESDLKFKDSGAYKMEVHCFLFTDMLLITKPVKKLGEKTKYKMIRQPFAVDRLICQEMSASIGCVYLNQFNTAVTAFTLTSSEHDLLKNWLDSIKKARSQLAQLTNQPLPMSRQPSEDVVVDELKPSWACPSPRENSRVSSLVHSHSGSIELTENISSFSSVSRGISVENTSEQRGSSLSSEDGNPSPRPRRSPNTLTVHTTHLGQSLPNLNLASISPNSPRSPNSLYLAPPKALSPTHRGITYPPPSPPRGSLQRGIAIAPRNPPLLKTSRVELSRSLSIAHERQKHETKQTKECVKATLSEKNHLKVSNAHTSSSGFSSGTSSAERLSSAVKFGEILEMVRLEGDKSPLELFESKVEQWRRYGFTGGGEDEVAERRSLHTAPLGQRSRSEDISKCDARNSSKQNQSRRCSSL